MADENEDTTANAPSKASAKKAEPKDAAKAEPEELEELDVEF